jgi:diguanylate cyclase (GGDEF)-like protein/PAS domain S-box-containing protein
MSQPGAMNGRPSLTGEPLLAAAAAAAVVATLWFLVNLHGPVGPPVLGWLPALTSLVLAVASFWRTATTPGLPPTARRFWRMLTLAALMACGSPGLPIVTELIGPVPYQGTVFMAVSAAAMAPLLWALYRLPLGAGNQGDVARLALDIATVTIAGVLFVWYFLIEPVVGRAPTDQRLGAAWFVIGCAVCVLAIVKVILGGSRTIDPLALRLLGAGLLVDLAGSALQPTVEGRGHLNTFQVGAGLAAVLVIAAAQRQRRAVGEPTASAATTARRPFSVLPYVAVAAADGLLLVSVARPGHHRTVVAVGAVVLTAIVVVRQLMAFRDNARLTEQIGRQELRFRSLVQSASDVIAILDRAGRTTYVSPGGQRLTGRPVAELLSSLDWFTEDADDTSRARWDRLVAEPGVTVTYQTGFRHAGGDWRWLEVTQTNLLDEPAVGGVVTNLRDITESQAYQRQLTHQASHDSLTELANRSLFGEQLELAIGRSGPGRLSLALIDLDDFKAVNDTLGHQAGDELLVAVAERLRRSVRPNDLVARLGGDEFAVLLEGIGSEHVGHAADRIIGALIEPITVEDQDLLVQASIGIADLGPDDDGSRLLRHADIAMYEAKAAGKGRYCRYTSDMTALASPGARQAAELRQALLAGELELHYQPIVALPAGDIVGVEALVRWRHPDQGLIPPGDFIPLAERTGLIVPIGQWVVGVACRQAAIWLADPATEARGSVSVNISARHLRDQAVVDHVVTALAESGLPAGRLTLEITETAVLGHAAAFDAVRALRGLGVRVALDDFGTGHSTLALLPTCPVDELKLDRSFLPDGDQSAIASAVVCLADGLGIDVVAEGVETPTQADTLCALGYRKAQGFHFGRPEPAGSPAHEPPVRR